LVHPDAVPAKTIVVAVDGSPPSREAGRYAVQFAKEMGARLHIVHVVEFSAIAVAAAESSGGAWTAMLPSMQEDARGVVGATVREAEAAGVPHTVRVVEGYAPHTAIINEAEEHRAWLIVVGSHGRTGLERALVGSVAERVVRMAGRPVLVHR
jgi:nucleotide-binding universal stress UspA family protein